MVAAIRCGCASGRRRCCRRRRRRGCGCGCAGSTPWPVRGSSTSSRDPSSRLLFPENKEKKNNKNRMRAVRITRALDPKAKPRNVKGSTAPQGVHCPSRVPRPYQISKTLPPPKEMSGKHEGSTAPLGVHGPTKGSMVFLLPKKCLTSTRGPQPPPPKFYDFIALPS